MKERERERKGARWKTTWTSKKQYGHIFVQSVKIQNQMAPSNGNFQENFPVWAKSFSCTQTGKSNFDWCMCIMCDDDDEENKNKNKKKKEFLCLIRMRKIGNISPIRIRGPKRLTTDIIYDLELKLKSIRHYRQEQTHHIHWTMIDTHIGPYFGTSTQPSQSNNNNNQNKKKITMLHYDWYQTTGYQHRCQQHQHQHHQQQQQHHHPTEDKINNQNPNIR